MELDDVLHDREPEAGAAFLARARLVHAIEALEDPLLILLGDTGAGITHLAPDVSGSLAERNGHVTTLGVLDRVVEQIGEHLLDATAIRHHRDRRPRLD